MAATGWDRETSPYHQGERELHDRLGRGERQERAGRQMYRPFMPDQHRQFFSQLPHFFLGSVDAVGQPWASMVFGRQGFVSSPTDRQLRLATTAIPGDPLAGNLHTGAPVGGLGIELPTRRRNRVNGVVGSVAADHFTVDVVQSFGNCPKYIHTRSPTFRCDPDLSPAPDLAVFDALPDEAISLILTSDSFFVSSYSDRGDKHGNGGADVSYRGGNRGFVKIAGNTLTVPDFVGNFAFNTLGNFVVTPRAGLLFVDFASGHLLQMTGDVELLWDANKEIEAFPGAQRAWRFHLAHGHLLRHALPFLWLNGEASPHSLKTGTWEAALSAQPS